MSVSSALGLDQPDAAMSVKFHRHAGPIAPAAADPSAAVAAAGSFCPALVPGNIPLGLLQQQALLAGAAGHPLAAAA